MTKGRRSRLRARPRRISRREAHASTHSLQVQVWTQLKIAESVVAFGSKTPMSPAQPEEISPAYAFLASPQRSSYITGEILPVIGGY